MVKGSSPPFILSSFFFLCWHRSSKYNLFIHDSSLPAPDSTSMGSLRMIVDSFNCYIAGGELTTGLIMVACHFYPYVV